MAFYITYVLIFLTPALVAGFYGNTHQTPQEAQQSGAQNLMFLIYYVITCWYMAKRWKLLGTPADKPTTHPDTPVSAASNQ
jgi:hypothetical protein